MNKVQLVKPKNIPEKITNLKMILLFFFKVKLFIKISVKKLKIWNFFKKLYFAKKFKFISF